MLNEKEKKIIEFLLEKNNKSMQSTIRHGTNIPRTSLTRTLKNLKTKNIVKINREGKAVKSRTHKLVLK